MGRSVGWPVGDSGDPYPAPSKFPAPSFQSAACIHFEDLSLPFVPNYCRVLPYTDGGAWREHETHFCMCVRAGAGYPRSDLRLRGRGLRDHNEADAVRERPSRARR